MASVPNFPPTADEDRNGNKGTTVPGKQNNARSQAEQIIQERTKNPLSVYSSYTYQLSLYMVSPAAYNAFVESGRTNINSIGTPQSLGAAANQNEGIFLIAQSGGINRKENRAPYFDLDYYIDDLKFDTAINAAATRGAANTLELKFKIIEPYGFSFITKIKLAASTLRQSKNNVPGWLSNTNSIQQFFILGIRFIGYDSEGNVINSGIPSNSVEKKIAEQLYEQYYDILITKLTFKLDGRSTVYNIEARQTPNLIGFGTKYGIVDNNNQIVAKNVKEALELLKFRLTQASAKSKINNIYDIQFRGENVNEIEDALFYSEADLIKINSGMTIARTVNDVNEANSLANLPRLKSRQIAIKNDTPVLQVIDEIISQSDYMTKALSVIYKSNLQANSGTNSKIENRQNENKEIKWYHVSTVVKIKSFDLERQDYSYYITYIIEPYKTPVVRAAYVPKTSRYYGPHKRYRYYFTGENSEIINYEQQYNNAYFTIQNIIDSNPQGQQNATQGQGPVVPNKRQDQSRQNDPDVGRESVNAYKTAMYDPGSVIQAKINILGDPDFIMQPTLGSLTKKYNQFYGPGYTINANGGQVFIEVDFCEAEDYDAEEKTGLLSVNNRIFFWDYPDDIKDQIKGIVYLVYKVTSTFSQGKFTQEINCVMPPIPTNSQSLNQSAAEDARLNRSANTSTTQVNSPPITPTNPGPSAGTTQSSSQRTVPAKNTVLVQSGNNAGLSGQVITNNPDPVQDEDSGNKPPSSGV